MEKIAVKMYLYPGNQEEYQKRHDQLWPEMMRALKAHGATNYSIFLDSQTDELFSYLEVPDRQAYDLISKTVICRKWWAYMAPLMKSNLDNSPVTQELRQVFHLA